MSDFEKWAQSEEFKHIQQAFQGAIGVSCRLIDYKGRALAGQGETSPIMRECEKWRDIEETLEKSAREASVQAVTDGAVRMYRALKQLTFFVVPMTFGGAYLGAFQVGPVRIADAPFEIVDYAGKSKKKEETFCKINQPLIDDLPCLSVEKFKSIASVAKMWLGRRVELEQQLKEQTARGAQSTAIIEQQYRKIEAYEKREKQPRQENLENRLNMHFWFNSLTSAANLAIIEGAMRTNEMITLISDFLRATLFEHDTFWTIAQETEAVESYLRIQGVRFGERIQYKIDVPRSMMKLHIPKMTLIPFVEDSAIAVINQNEGGQILVRMVEDAGHLICEIVDNASHLPSADVPAEAKNHYSIEENIDAVRDKLARIYGTGYHIARAAEDGENHLVISIPKGGPADV